MIAALEVLETRGDKRDKQLCRWWPKASPEQRAQFEEFMGEPD